MLVVSEGLKETLDLSGIAVFWDVTCVIWLPHIPEDRSLNIHGLETLMSEYSLWD
jgi:hypothetical protein